MAADARNRCRRSRSRSIRCRDTETTRSADKDIWRSAVVLDGIHLRRAGKNMKGDWDIVMAAVCSRGEALAFASAALQEDAGFQQTNLFCSRAPHNQQQCEQKVGSPQSRRPTRTSSWQR